MWVVARNLFFVGVGAVGIITAANWQLQDPPPASAEEIYKQYFKSAPDAVSGLVGTGTRDSDHHRLYISFKYDKLPDARHQGEFESDSKDTLRLVDFFFPRFPAHAEHLMNTAELSAVTKRIGDEDSCWMLVNNRTKHAFFVASSTSSF